MDKKIINLNDQYSKNMKEEIRVVSGRNDLRGEVSIFEKKNGKVGRLLQKKNMIVFNGRAWLLRKAFGTSLDGNVSEIYDKEIRWFGIGVSPRNANGNEVSVSMNQRAEVKKGKVPSRAIEIPKGDLKDGLDQGIGGFTKGEGSYNMKIKIDPPVLKVGGTASVNIQFLENDKPYNGSVIFVLKLGGSAKFVANNSQELEIPSNQQGSASIKIVTDTEETVNIQADVKFSEEH